jgi:hypothetical protein
MILRITTSTGTINISKQTVRVVRVYNRNVPDGITANAFGAKGDLLVGTGDGTYIAVPAGRDGEYIVFDSSQPAGVRTEVPSLTVEDTTNHLINGGFNFAQRQTPGTLTTISDLGYGPDRWKMTRENADLQYIRVDGSSESGLTSPYYGQFKKITNAGKILICQPLKYLDTLKFRDKSCSFQVQMKASASKTIKIAIVQLQTGGTADTLPTLVSAWGADSTDPTLGANLATIGTPTSCAVTTSWQTFQFAGTFPATAKNLIVMVWSDADFAANDTLSLAEAGLYFGENVRSWTPGDAATDLEKCKEYGRLMPQTPSGRAESTTKACFVVPLSPAMRIAPTPSTLGTITVRDFNATLSKNANTPSIAASGTTAGIYVELSASSWSAANFTTGDIVALNCAEGSGIFLNSEL